MAVIPRAYINDYVDAIAKVSGTSRENLKTALENIDWTQTVASVRNQIIDVMQVYCSGATNMAAMLAAEFYDGLREISVGSRMGALAYNERNPDATDGAVRAFMQDIVDGKGSNSVIRKCLERLDYETKRAAATCVEKNARRDPSKPRYARIPAGNDTCDFCIMLASRGPVYRSEASAGALDHFHTNCRCQVVPMWNTYEIGPSRRASATTEVEGYDPDVLYERYVDMMLDPDFRDRMARGAANARGGSRNVTGKETSHPQLWAQALRDGKVTLGSVGEVTNYIRRAKSYEDLFERIELINRELPYYGLSTRYITEFRRELVDKRKELIGR